MDMIAIILINYDHRLTHLENIGTLTGFRHIKSQSIVHYSLLNNRIA